MSDFRPDLDTRTCSACDEPAAERLRGYMQSLRVCERHLAEWRASDARRTAMLTAISSGRLLGHEPFDAWAEKNAWYNAGNGGSMQIVITGVGVFVALMAAGIGGARMANVEFTGGGYGAMFVMCVMAGGVAATAKALWNEGRDR